MSGEKEAFRIVEPDGKIYRIYADGRVEGFAKSAVICNRIPALIRQAVTATGRKPVPPQTTY